MDASNPQRAASPLELSNRFMQEEGRPGIVRNPQKIDVTT